MKINYQSMIGHLTCLFWFRQPRIGSFLK